MTDHVGGEYGEAVTMTDAIEDLADRMNDAIENLHAAYDFQARTTALEAAVEMNKDTPATAFEVVKDAHVYLDFLIGAEAPENAD